MLLKQDLKKISKNRLEDSNVLLQNKRYSAAMYLAGYAIELMLKLKICHVFRFNRGFPENRLEFNAYKDAAASESLLHTTIRRLEQIKNHNLSELLRYSGEEVKILGHFSEEWAVVESWRPEQRYSASVIRKGVAVGFIKSCKMILQNL
jgi:HEPN domain-containing protein